MRAWARGIAAGVTCLLGGCSGVLDPQGPVAAAERILLLDSTVIMLTVVVPVILAIFGFAWWYRSGNARATYLPDFEYSGSIEFTVWSIPAMIVIFLGGIAWISAHDLDPYRPLDSKTAPIDVQVVSLDWKWLFIYPGQGVASVNTLTIPAGTPVNFHLTAQTVMNSFFVPQLGSQIYTMGSMTTQLSLQADRPGDYQGLSSMYSGDGFSDMHFVVHAVPAAAFQSWVTQTRGTGDALDATAYTQLSKPSIKVAPFTFKSVQQNLFDQIVARSITTQEGPQGGRPTADISPRTENK